MNRIERVYKAIARQPEARIPTGELTMDRAFMEALLAWGGIAASTNMTDVDLLVASARLLHHDVVCLPQAGAHRDRRRSLESIARFVDEGFFVFWIEDGAFQRSLHRHDFMNFMQAVAAEPETVAAEIERASQTVTANIRQAVAHGAHGILIAEDIAYQNSTYVSPDFGRRHLLPLWRVQTAAARQAGAPAFFHSDGNINRFLPLIAAAGFDGLQCIEPAAHMDIFAIREMYGSDLCLMGNLDPALLCDAPANEANWEETLDRAVGELLLAFQASGGLILGSCSGLHAGMVPQRVGRVASRVEAFHQPGVQSWPEPARQSGCSGVPQTDRGRGNNRFDF